MKSLLKFSFICLFTFFATGMLQAQCSNVGMSVTKVGEDAYGVIYHFKVTTNTVVDKIKLVGIATCDDTSSCSNYVRVSKSCQQKIHEFKCESENNGCVRRDGCVVIISPQVVGCNSGY